MVSTIWKYPLETTVLQKIIMPCRSRFISVIEQNDQPVMYFMVDEKQAAFEKKWVYIFGTGHPLVPEAIDGTAKHRGTISTHEGKLIWHIFM